MELKGEIRKQMRKARRILEHSEWQSKTERIAAKVIQSDSFREATDLFCYMNIDYEVGTREIIEEAWRLGKDVWLPKVSGDDMDFYLVQSFAELSEGSFHIPEPSGESEKASIDDGLMIVPGVAFGKDCQRIGYGKGYYDRYIKEHPDLLTLGIAFDVQIMERVPSQEHDCRLDLVLTETLELNSREVSI